MVVISIGTGSAKTLGVESLSVRGFGEVGVYK